MLPPDQLDDFGPATPPMPSGIKDCCKKYRELGLNYCGICNPRVVTKP